MRAGAGPAGATRRRRGLAGQRQRGRTGWSPPCRWVRAGGPAGRLLRDRGQVGGHVLAALGQLEGHLRLGAVIAGGLLQPGGRVGDIGGQRGFVPGRAGGADGQDRLAILEVGVRADGLADDAVKVRAGLAALLDLGPVGGDDRVAGLALLELGLARGRIAARAGVARARAAKVARRVVFVMVSSSTSDASRVLRRKMGTEALDMQ